MKRALTFILLFYLSMNLSFSSLAESCDTNCHDQCGICLFGGCIVEPTCHAKCEVAKKAACVIGSPLPTIPTTPIEQGKVGAEAVCGSVYFGITQPVVAACSNFDNRLEGQLQIDSAKQVLIHAGLFQPNEFDGVQIRSCPNFSGEGIAPEAGRIYLQPRNVFGDLGRLSHLLAHEMTHIRQHRARGLSRFACDYSREYTGCGGCQDRRNGLEREAMDFADTNWSRIAASLNPPRPRASICFINPYPYGQCPLGVSLSVGDSCYCPTPFGPLWGVAR